MKHATALLGVGALLFASACGTDAPAPSTTENPSAAREAERGPGEPASGDAQFRKAREAYSAGEFGKALALWLPMAEAGDARAQNNLGKMYYLGQGVEKDLPEALRRFRQAADNGAEMAYQSLSVMHIRGEGTVVDEAEAYRWLVLAEGAGYALPSEFRDAMLQALSDEQRKSVERAAEIYLAEHPPLR